MKRWVLLLIPLISLAFPADARPRRRPPDEEPQLDPDDGAHARRPPRPRALTVPQAANEVTYALYNQARNQPGNLVLSPISAFVALGMTYGGSAGQTATEMAAALRLQGLTVDQVQQGQAELMAALGKQPGLRFANRLWGDKRFPFDKAYLAALEKRYGAGLERADFRKRAEAARKAVNAWVSKRTAKRIPALLPEGGVTDRTRLVLVNAVTFEGGWARKFDEKASYEGAFMLADGQTTQATFMTQSGEFRFAQLDGISIVELPYAGGDLAMTILLPDDWGGLEAVEAKLSTGWMARWLGALQLRKDVSLTIPRFRASLGLELSAALAAIGMPTAFDPDRADFTGMIADDAEERLFISKVFHQAFVEVDEAGTKAAAATGVVMAEPTSVRQTPTFRADHPFVWLIRDRKTGVVLFVGRVADPSKVGS